MSREEKKVILASSLGTVFEWYDFYLYGALAAIIGAQFFSQYPEATRNVFALLAFAAGFLVRPFGALVFGRLGDLVGRKYTFLITILIMGLSTFLVGCLPSYDSIGFIAPVALIALRMAQGLALGGEYGGAAIYVAEHAPPGRRGFFTSWIQTTATLGLLLSLIVIMFTQIYVNANFAEVTTAAGAKITPFAAWGWRIPFLVSIVLLGVSVWIRLQMQESPAFQKMKEEGSLSKAPLTEAFGQWRNAKIALLALFGLVAGQAVVWYTGQFYALFFLQNILKVDAFTANVLIAWSLVLGTGGFIVFGALSDRIGRKPIILAGCLIAAVTYFPLFKLMTATANPALLRGPGEHTGHHHRRPRGLLVPVQPDRHGQVHKLLRHRQGAAGTQLGERDDRQRAGRHRRQSEDRRQGIRRQRSKLRRGCRRGPDRGRISGRQQSYDRARSRSTRRQGWPTSPRCSTSSARRS